MLGSVVNGKAVAPAKTHVIMSHYLISRLSPIIPLVIFIITPDAKAVNRPIVHQIHVATMTNRKPAGAPRTAVRKPPPKACFVTFGN
jgi:hypothetical protein